MSRAKQHVATERLGSFSQAVSELSHKESNISPRKAVAEKIEDISLALKKGYTFREICKLLKDTSGINLAPTTLKNYFYEFSSGKRPTAPTKKKEANLPPTVKQKPETEAAAGHNAPAPKNPSF